MNYLACYKQTAHPLYTITVHGLKSIVLLAVILTLCLQHAYAQSHPGGDAHTNYYWFKGDAGITLNSSAQVTIWKDVASGVSITPMYGPENRVTPQDPEFNYNSSLTQGRMYKNDFDKRSSTSGGSFFIVTRQYASQISDYRISPFTAGKFNPRSFPSGSFYWLRNLNMVVYGASSSYLYRPYIATINPGHTKIRNIHAYDTYIRTFFDQKAGSWTNIPSNYTMYYGGLNFLVMFDQGSFAVPYKGKVAECLIFLNPITDLQRKKVTSYLALKYGVSLNQDLPNDYYASNPQIHMWGATVAGIYKHHIAGIGRDDTTALHQVRSRSIIGEFVEILGENEGSNISPAFNDIDNMEFLSWAHDNKNLNMVSTGLPYQLSERIDRTWKAQEVGELGTLQVDFYTYRIPGISGKVVTDFTLIVDSDADFSNGGTRLYSASNYSSSTGKATFSGVQLNHGEFFSLSTKRAPVKVEFMQTSTAAPEVGGTSIPRLILSGGAPLITSYIDIVLGNSPGTATAGLDYDPNFGTPLKVTIPAGDYNTPQTISIPGLSIRDDKIIEQSETMTLVLQNGVGNIILGTKTSTTHTITDNDTLMVSFDRASGTDNESSGGNLPQLQLLGAIINSPLSVTIGGFSAAAGTATSGADYLPNLTPLTMTIPVGNYISPKNIPIPDLSIINDLSIEPDETFELVLQNPSRPLIAGSVVRAVYTIQDDDKLTVAFSQATGSDSESSGGNLPSLTVSGAIISVQSTVEVVLSSTPGSATAGMDYTPNFSSPLIIIIPVGNYTSPKNIPIADLSITNDAIIEPDETLELVLQNPSSSVVLGSQDTILYTITDNDKLTVEFSQATGSDSESSGGNLPALKVSGGISTTSVTLQVALSGTPGSATAGVDYAPTFGAPLTVTIPAGDYITPQQVSLDSLSITKDSIIEASETIQLTLQTLGSGVILGSQVGTVYTITDDDSLTVAFDRALGTDNESSGGNLPQLQVLGAITTAPLTVGVILSGTPGTAIAGVDYAPNFNTPLIVTIPAGNYTTPQQVSLDSLSITKDSIIEASETIMLTLQNPVGKITLGAQRSTVYTITDDDKLTVEFSQATGSDNESSGGNLPALIVSGATITAPSTVIVAMSPSPGTAITVFDFLPNYTPIRVTIPKGDYTTKKTIAIPYLSIVDDSVIEADETIKWVLHTPDSAVDKGSLDTTTYTIKNDDKITVEFSQATGIDSESSGGNLPTLKVSGAILAVSLKVQVALSTTLGSTTSATPGVDYTPNLSTPLMLDIPVGNYTIASSISITLAIIKDIEMESSETIQLTLQNPDSNVILGAQTGTFYTITDDDSLIVSFNAASHTDNEVFGGQLPPISVRGAITTTTQTVGVILSNTPGTATAGVDYTPNFSTPLIVSIPAGNYTSPKSLPIGGIAIIDDTIVERSETMILTLQNSGDKTILDTALHSTVYTIIDNDQLTVEFSQDSGTDSESSGGNLPTLKASGAITAIPLTVEVTMSNTPSNTATAGVDYKPTFGTPMTVTIPVGDYRTPQQIPLNNLSIINDSIMEESENIILGLKNLSNKTKIGAQRITVYTIKDDDMLSVSFDRATGSDSESSGGNLPGLKVSGAITTSPLTVEVTLSGTPGSATAGSDYTPNFSTPLTITLPAGDYSTTQIIPVPGLAITKDDLIEPEETFVLKLQNPSGSLKIGTQQTTVYTIVNDDSLSVVFDRTTGSDKESSGRNFPGLSVSGGVSLTAFTVKVALSDTPGSATAGADYTPSLSTPLTVTLAAGDYTSAKTIAIVGLAITKDNLIEPDETINLLLKSPSGAVLLGSQSTTTYTIVDDDSLTVAFSQATGSDKESSGGNLPGLTLSGASITAPLTIEVIVSSTPSNAMAGADYMPAFTNPMNIVLPTGDYSTAQTIPIVGLSITNDALIEPNESFSLQLKKISAHVILGAQSTTSYTIVDNDTLLVAFDRATGSDSESSGGNLPGLRVSGAISFSPYTIEIALPAAPGSATAGVDYMPNLNSSLTMTLPAGNYTTVQVLPIPGLTITNDALIEPNETFSLQLQNPSGVVALDAQQTAEYTILNDDSVTVAFDRATSSDSESSGGNLPQVMVSGAITDSPLTVTVMLGTPGSATAGVDYEPNFSTPITITIPVGDYVTPQAFQIPGLSIRNDVSIEPNETFSLQLQSASASVLLTQQTMVYTISNDDKLTVSFDQATGSDSESSGGNLPKLMVIGDTNISPLTVEVVLSSSPGNATAGGDYTPDFNTPLIVNIPAGDYSTAKVLSLIGLSIIDDADLEDNETFSLTLQSPSSGVVLGSRITTVYTIDNDESLPKVSLTVSDLVIAEAGGKSTIGVSMGSRSFQNVTVTLSFSGSLSSNEYRILSNQIVIPAGSTSGSLLLTSLDDVIREGDESLVVAIESVKQGTEDGDQKATIVVKDNEPLPQITMSIDNSSIQEEGGIAVVTAKTNLISKKDIRVLLVFAGQAIKDSDYKVAASSIVIPAGKTSGSLNLVAVEDIFYEFDELIRVSISSVENGELNGTQTVETAIKDSGNPPKLSISTDVSSIREVDKGTALLTVQLAAVSVYETTFELVVSGQVSDSDFTLSSNTFTIPAGELSVKISFTAVDDIVQENKESALIKLDKVVNAQIDVNKSMVTVQIEDDDLVIVNQGFSPNGDGFNDVWYIDNITKYPNNHIQVYNRWGNLVYEARNYNNQDQSFSGYANVGFILGGSGLPDGTYFYLINLGNGSKMMNGFVVLRK